MREFPGKRRNTSGLDNLITSDEAALKGDVQAHAWSNISPTVRKLITSDAIGYSD